MTNSIDFQNKIIWMCWFQGENSVMPPLNRACIEKWRVSNKDWKVIVLNNETIPNYVPEYTEILKESPKRKLANCADLLRLLLLSKYGGVWVDASVYPTRPLSNFTSQIINEQDFFAYRYIPQKKYDTGPRKGAILDIDVWFLCATKPNHYLIETWKNEFIKKYKTFKSWPYFTLAETIRELYKTDSKIKKIIDNMIQLNAEIPTNRSLTRRPKQWKNSFVWKRPNWKLWTWKGWFE